MFASRATTNEYFRCRSSWSVDFSVMIGRSPCLLEALQRAVDVAAPYLTHLPLQQLAATKTDALLPVVGASMAAQARAAS